MDAVASRPPTHYDHHVPRLRIAARCVPRREPDRAAEDQRIVGVARVIEHRPRDGRHAELVAVVAHARHHARLDARGVKH